MAMASPSLRLGISTRAPPRIDCNPHTYEHIGTPPGPRNREVTFDPPESRDPDQTGPSGSEAVAGISPGHGGRAAVGVSGIRSPLDLTALCSNICSWRRNQPRPK